MSTDIYIADTFGEMGLWYRVSAVTFIGHSLAVPGKILTGKNPFEALALGQMVLHGKNFGNFTKIYEMLLEKRASRAVLNSIELADDLCEILNNEKFRIPYLKAAQAIISQGAVGQTRARIRLLAEVVSDKSAQASEAWRACIL